MPPHGLVGVEAARRYLTLGAVHVWLLLAERVQGPLQLGGDFCAEGVRVTSQPIADTDFYLYVLARPGAVGTCSPDPAAPAPADAATCAAVATRSACVSEAGCAYAATSTLAVGRACETDQFGRPISGGLAPCRPSTLALSLPPAE